MKKAIQTAFKDATENDISLFYYSGHGSADGALCSFEDNGNMGFVSPKRLAKWLSNVPSKVVVILDSCYSGKAIEKSKGLNDTKRMEDAQKSVIEAFQMQDKMLSQKSGELKEKGKFFVLTSCSTSEVCADDGENGLFTGALIEGAGYRCDTNQRMSKAPADIAKDNKLTMEELWRYSLPRALGNAKCYPTNCGMKIFQR